MESEISSTRKEKSDAVSSLEEEKLRHVHELASSETKTNRALSNVKEFERKCLRLEERLEKANSTCNSQRKMLCEKDNVLRKFEQERDSEREKNRKKVNNLQVQISALKSKSESEQLESIREVERLKRTLQETIQSKEKDLSASSSRETNLIQERDNARKELEACRVENRRERT